MHQNNRFFSLFKTWRAMMMLTLIGVIPFAYAQIAFSQMPKQILTCDHAGFPSCYSTGYNAGLLNRGTFSSCSGSVRSVGSPTQVNNYCLGFSAAQQQQQQQEHR